VAFKRTRAGIAITLDPVEVAVLTQVIGEMFELVGPLDSAAGGEKWARDLGLGGVGADSDVPAPDPETDPIRARLFPDGYRDDKQAASDFRRFTEDELRAGKAANADGLLRSLPESGGTIVLDEDGCSEWLGALNDARLALGTALEVDENTSYELATLEANEPRARRLLLYMWLGELQDSLLEALMDG
jgi:hypothetical protein